MNNQEILEKAKSERLGEIRKNKGFMGGYEMKIVEYNRSNDIWVEFQDKYKAKVHTKYCHFKSGNVKNPYHPSVHGIGYIGQGKYKCRVNGKITKVYNVWSAMIQRCYDAYFINKNLTYRDCYVCDEWHNFQNFAKWFYKHYYEVEGETMDLDKDILVKGNKIYSPETCIFVPHRINSLFIKRDALRGKYPVGIHWNKEKNKFQARCKMCEGAKHLGYYNTIEEAFLAYKNFKENYIKQVADEYKDLIPTKLYNAMYKYEVEIND